MLGHRDGIESDVRIFKKYGKNLKVKNKLSRNISELAYPKTLKTQYII